MSETNTTTARDLFEAFKLGLASDNITENDITSYRYVIYARKSTESEERQARSLSDQTLECRDLANNNKLTVAKVIQESESAKEPDIRPKFRAMLEDFNKGKYDGIIAWHPDRLARNMKDAGEMIDLLDKKIIKDLKFVSFTFENNTMGKMLLGIAFVLSKQYSDQLSDNVKRGIRRSIEEGKFLNKAKHGYYKDRNQFLRPDGENYQLIKNAFRMRAEGTRLEEVADYLNEHNYTRAHRLLDESKRQAHIFTQKTISVILRDPFYMGILKYGGNTVYLSDLYDFVPMIEVEEFLKINKLSDLKKALRLSGKYFKEGSIKANLLRGIVFCGECGESMTSGITNKKSGGKTTSYYYYRCDNQECAMRGKSNRAHIITDFVYDFLEKNKFASKPTYDKYVVEMNKIIGEREREIDKELRSFSQSKLQKEKKFEQIKNLILNEEDKETAGYFKGDLKACENEIDDLGNKIDELKAIKNKNKTAIMTFSEYIELFDNLPKLMKKIKRMDDLDYILRKICLNFTIKDGKVSNFTINSPFREFMKQDVILTSRGAEN